MFKAFAKQRVSFCSVEAFYLYKIKKRQVILLKNIDLSKRLHKASEYAVPGQPILDIGSDHAYLPIYLVQQNTVPSAIAGEVAIGPLKNAQKKIASHGLEQQISVRLGDGLAVLEEQDELGTLFICGMGGILIRDILKEGFTNPHFPKDARIVLQPNNSETTLREFLVRENYEIVAETILEDKHKLYEIIVAEPANQVVTYTEEELSFGPHLMKERSTAFMKKWQRELDNYKQILEQLKDSKNTARLIEVNENIQKIEKVIS